MLLPSPSRSNETERAEWELVLAALSHTPRLSNLLRYIGELYFNNKINEITEFNIATEVFGRSKSIFDSSKDSIARVEAYRLRKKLKEYYLTDGKNHATMISLPAGSYVPTFLHLGGSDQPHPAISSGADPFQPESSPVVEPDEAEETPNANRRISRRRIALYALAVAASLLAVAAVVSLTHRGAAVSNHGSMENHSTVALPANPAHMPLRILAGYEGSPKIDSAGNYWEADRYFLAGVARPRPDRSISKTSDPMLFEHWRINDSKYDIPLAPGIYELHLFFVASQNEDASMASFNVDLNGKPLLIGFNISSDALGSDIADERVFKDVSPDTDGYLHLHFYTNRTEPSISAIEIFPGLPHKQIPIRLVTQRAAVSDSSGNIWHSDNYFQNGRISDLPQKVSGTSDPDLYAQERFGHFMYSIPVDTRGRYTLVLHFAELYWAPDPGVGRRVFRVFCNGSTLLEDFDIFKEVGNLHAVTKTFHHLRPSTEGKLDITFDPIVNNATVSAIEVIDESE
jgi:hypothetical protein